MVKVSASVRWFLLVGLVGSMTVSVLNCDCFLSVGGHVSDCATSQPLADVTMTVHVDDGIGNTGETLSQTAMTKADGAFGVSTDQNCGDEVTLRFAKPGYEVLDLPIKGTPSKPLEVCLNATP